MLEFLHQVFSWLCGQSPAHTWSPGGELLPCCQRCTGLYAGACVAAVLHLVLRPPPTNRWLWLNGSFLLFMVPFGFHWLPQDAVLRSITGVLFGFGLVAFLSLPLAGAEDSLPALNPDEPAAWRARSRAVWLAGLLATLGMVPWLGARGDAFAAHSLAVLAAAGALAGLVLSDLVLALGWLGKLCFNRMAHASA